MRHLVLAAAAALAMALAGCSAHPKPLPPSPAQSEPSANAPTPAASGPASPESAAQPNVVPYAKSMPADAGKEEVVTLCTNCHGLYRIVSAHKSRADWAYTLQVMQGNGLSATQVQLARVLDYLAKHYPPVQ